MNNALKAQSNKPLTLMIEMMSPRGNQPASAACEGIGCGFVWRWPMGLHVKYGKVCVYSRYSQRPRYW